MKKVIIEKEIKNQFFFFKYLKTANPTYLLLSIFCPPDFWVETKENETPNSTSHPNHHPFLGLGPGRLSLASPLPHPKSRRWLFPLPWFEDLAFS